MSTIKFEEMNTWETFKDFLKAYHPRLKQNKSFPPLGIQKALHEAAPIFGYSNGHEMAHALEGKASPVAAPSTAFSKNEVLEVLQFVNEVNAAVENESVSLVDVAEAMHLEMSEIYTLLDMTETVYNQVLRGELTIEPAGPKEPEKVKVVTVTVITMETDHETLDKVTTKVMRSQEEAEEYIRGLVRTMASDNDRTADEIRECRDISWPDDEGVEEMDEEELLEWVIKNHGVLALIELIAYLDYELTTVEMGEDWI